MGLSAFDRVQVKFLLGGRLYRYRHLVGVRKWHLLMRPLWRTSDLGDHWRGSNSEFGLHRDLPELLDCAQSA